MDLVLIQESFRLADNNPTGIACLSAVFRYWGRYIKPYILSNWAQDDNGITKILGLQTAALYSGFNSSACKLTIDQLKTITEPIILCITNKSQNNDYVIFYGLDNELFIIGDTSIGLYQLTLEELADIWINRIALLILPNKLFSEKYLCQNIDSYYYSGHQILNEYFNNNIKCDVDILLSPIDNAVFSDLIYKINEPDFNWVDILDYLIFRIENSAKELHSMSVPEMINVHNLIYALDCIDRLIPTEQLSDQLINRLNLINELNVCPYKIPKILEKKRSVITLKEKVDENEITIVIPVRIDSIERERNLEILLSELTNKPNVKIIILEADEFSRYKNKYSKVEYHFFVDNNPIFHRTKYLNILLKLAKTNIVGIWDTDVIVSHEQIEQAVHVIRTGMAVMSFPYDGRFCMLSEEGTELYIQTNSITKIEQALSTWSMPYGEYSVGGAFFVNKEIYLRYGGENESFLGWGPEDAERVRRMDILGLTVFRVKGPLYHLFHPRNFNSRYSSRDLEIMNRREYLTVCAMTKNELLKYIGTWQR